MQASRLFVSTLTAAGVIGLASLATAQTGTTTTTPGGTTTTITPPSVTTETEAERMNRERMDRERMSTPSVTGTTTPAPIDRPMDSTARRDANGNLIAQADRN